MDKDSYSLELSRCIHRNPVKAHVSKTPEECPWSIYAFFMSSKIEPAFQETGFILSQFKTIRHPRRFTKEGLADWWDPFKKSQAVFLLGSEDFIEAMKEKLVPKEKNRPFQI